MCTASRTFGRLLSLIFLATVAAGPVIAQDTLVFDGAWKVVERWGHNPDDGEWRTETVQPSVYLFLDGYYSITAVTSDEPRPQIPDGQNRGTLSAEDAIAIWGPYTSNSGTYEVSGSTLTVRPIVALSPGFMDGGSSTYEYRFENGRLTLSVSREDWSYNLTLVRY